MTARIDPQNVATSPNESDTIELLPEAETQLVAVAGANAAVAGQWTLMLWKFRRQKVAVCALIIVVLLYLIAFFAEFLAPYGTDMTQPEYTYAPPQGLSLFLIGADSEWQFLPHAKGYTITVDDRSRIHNWVLSGDGVDGVATDVSGTGEKSFPVTLKAGEYGYVCDPHPSMTGTLKVT